MAGRSTIAALASPPGGGSRAILRISGGAARAIVERCFRPASANCALTDRGAFDGRLEDGTGTQPARLLWMPTPASYTGEDVAELHLVGSPPLARAALDAVVRLGAELARPGEFTRRAFENGKLDLSAAEGVLLLVEAGELEEARAAQALLGGGLASRAEALREGLEELRALVEATLDFAESDSLSVDPAELARRLDAALAQSREAQAFERARCLALGRPRVVIVGAPNAGKSALFNRLTGSQALVTDAAGTTRDRLSATWRLGDLEVELVDTAGLGATPLDIERRAQQGTLSSVATADLSLWVVDARRGLDASWTAEAPQPDIGGSILLVWNQIDREGVRPAPAAELLERLCVPCSATSAQTGAGLAKLATRVRELLTLRPRSGLARSVELRHLEALGRVQVELEAALELLGARAPLDLVAAVLRGATDALDGLTGRTTPEDLLERVFSRFCIGK